jgi:DNA-directed RNA polymerase specialized sigma24 family protein
VIESLLEKLPNAVHDKVDLPDSEGAAAYSESSFLEALPVIHHIVRRRRISFQQADVLDLAQGIALRLWRWRDKNGEKSDSMSVEEWNAYAARTAYNEVNRHLSKSARTGVSLDVAEHIAESSVEGDTETEVFSLIRSVWQEIGGFSLRQRRALLLHSQELVIYFLQSGISNEDLARILEFRTSEWNDIRRRIPLSDVQIAKLTKAPNEKRNVAAIAGAIKKARYDARKKLEGVGSK